MPTSSDRTPVTVGRTEAGSPFVFDPDLHRLLLLSGGDPFTRGRLTRRVAAELVALGREVHLVRDCTDPLVFSELVDQLCWSRTGGPLPVLVVDDPPWMRRTSSGVPSVRRSLSDLLVRGPLVPVVVNVGTPSALMYGRLGPDLRAKAGVAISFADSLGLAPGRLLARHVEHGLGQIVVPEEPPLGRGMNHG